MRADFILPVLLAAALAAMTIYAAGGDSRRDTWQTSPLQCRGDGRVTDLRGLSEASGLASSQHDAQLFWTHNDSGEPYVYAIAANGAIRGRVRVAGASVVDWEAVTTAPCDEGSCLFVGDIGDNNESRRSIVVYRTREPNPGDRQTADTVMIEAVYPEGPQDAEAMFVIDGRLFVVTKGEHAPVRLYRFPAIDGGARQTLELIVALNRERADRASRITDAAVSQNQRWVALRSNDQVLFFDAQSLLAGTPGTPLAFDVRGLKEPQGEGLAWGGPGALFLAGEGDGAGTFARISCNLPG